MSTSKFNGFTAGTLLTASGKEGGGGGYQQDVTVNKQTTWSAFIPKLKIFEIMLLKNT